jgi:hypothetical protein
VIRAGLLVPLALVVIGVAACAPEVVRQPTVLSPLIEHNQVFMVEGAHVHEAYLVLDGDQVVGYYLPVERAFAPAPDEKKTTLTIRRRDP